MKITLQLLTTKPKQLDLLYRLPGRTSSFSVAGFLSVTDAAAAAAAADDDDDDDDDAEVTQLVTSCWSAYEFT